MNLSLFIIEKLSKFAEKLSNEYIYDEDEDGDPIERPASSVIFALGKNIHGEIVSAIEMPHGYAGCEYDPGVYGKEMSAAYIAFARAGLELGGFSVVMHPWRAHEEFEDGYNDLWGESMGELPHKVAGFPVAVVYPGHLHAVKADDDQKYHLVSEPITENLSEEIPLSI